MGKLHNKNLGPYLVIARTGPVNYQIQGTPEGRLSTLHVDKLYKYSPTEGEELLSWLPVAKKSQEVASQSDLAAQTDDACQTEPLSPQPEILTPGSSPNNPVNVTRGGGSPTPQPDPSDRANTGQKTPIVIAHGDPGETPNNHYATDGLGCGVWLTNELG